MDQEIYEGQWDCCVDFMPDEEIIECFASWKIMRKVKCLNCGKTTIDYERLLRHEIVDEDGTILEEVTLSLDDFGIYK